MRRSNQFPYGTVHRFSLDSEVLEANPLGDPARRELFVYTPPRLCRRAGAAAGRPAGL
jgi:hypothetical protein